MDITESVGLPPTLSHATQVVGYNAYKVRRSSGPLRGPLSNLSKAFCVAYDEARTTMVPKRHLKY
jgi:hypothetical protein